MGGTQENYSAFLEEQKAMIETPNTLVSNKPSHVAKSENYLGYTKVWEGKPTEFIKVIKEWSLLDEDYLKVESAPNPSNIVLWVANEWIDWPNVRVVGSYRPANTNNYRSNSAIEKC